MNGRILRMAGVFVGAMLLAIARAGAQPENEKRAGNAAPTGPQVWKGKIEVPGTALDFVVRLNTSGKGKPTGTIDIPAQGAKGLALSDIEVTETALKFTLPVGAPADFELDIDETGKAAEGRMTQFGQKFIVTAERITEAEAADVGPNRPQTPKPPFPYKSEEVTFRNESDDVTLAGTLTLPRRKGPHAAVVLITGSGPQDRDETLLGHKPFLVLADHLTRRGMAVLRYDDRGVGESKASMTTLLNSTTTDLADDARAAVAFLRTRKDIDPKRIALAGHSEGGIIAPMIAAEDKEIACIAMLAGGGVPGRKILSGQLEKIAITGGTNRANVDRQLKAQAKFMDLLVAKADPSEIRPVLVELVTAQFEGAGQPTTKEKIEEAVEAAIVSNCSAWMREFIAHDPRESLRKVNCPVLALNGTLDTQVLPEDNLPEIEKALKEAGNEDVTIQRMKGLNHLFQTAGSGAPAEYLFIEETMSPAVLKETSKWLVKRLKVKSRKTKSKSKD